MTQKLYVKDMLYIIHNEGVGLSLSRIYGRLVQDRLRQLRPGDSRFGGGSNNISGQRRLVGYKGDRQHLFIAGRICQSSCRADLSLLNPVIMRAQTTRPWR